MAFGGSTSAALHLLAIAHEAGVDLTLDDVTRVAARVPHLGDLKPFGRYVMADGDRIRLNVAEATLDLLVDDDELAARRVGWALLPRATPAGCWRSARSWCSPRRRGPC